MTYGTLRRDAPTLAAHAFDYVVLNEAQTIKNANTAAAKAVRLLHASHRLALSGTPVENRLGDLWSLFEFLNPGLLSGASSFTRLFSSKQTDDAGLHLLSRGLRPFILPRTKEQVASDLPAPRPSRRWCANSTDRSAPDASAKLDLLVPKIVEATEENHKTLAFSQFTSFLALLRAQLDERGIEYEYLDGKTRDRAARVERFQTDPASRLFLISLKAGGLGLNLTAADYMFVLDPWWNPAAEAQAIDRAHHIGQTRNVFAYRLIARDTVEERVVELQTRKRQLADAIITEDNSVVRNLQREELELLLS